MPNVTWNPAAKNAAIVLDGTNTTATRTGASTYAGVRGTVGYSTGTYYFEALVPNGWGAEGAIGVANASASLNDPLGYGSIHGAGLYNDGSFYSGGGSANAGGITHGSRVGFLVNATSRRLWVKSAAGVWVIGGDPGASGPGFNISAMTGAIYPMATIYFDVESNTIYSEAETITLGLPAGAALWGDGYVAPPVTPVTRKPIRHGRWF